MNVTENLMVEHQLILRFLGNMNKILSQAEKSGDVAWLGQRIDRCVDFIQNFADHVHHGKEENILFEYLKRPEVLSHCSPIGQMLHEHDLGRDFVKGLIEARKKNDLKGMITNARGYEGLLFQHIMKEDNILYPMAEEGLSEELKTTIQNAYAAFEQKVDGNAMRKRYLDLCEGLV